VSERFSEGRKNAENDKLPGHPVTIKTGENGKM
jgi:hypothetical protein